MWGYVYILGIIPIFKIMVMCSTHTSHTFSTHPTHHTFSPFLLRYPLRQNSIKSIIFPLFTSSKITINQSKNPLKPLKIKLLSKSTKKSNLYHKNSPSQYLQPYIPISHNTNKINTFSLHKIHKIEPALSKP